MGKIASVTTSFTGRAIIKAYEGLRTEAYRDSVGRWTLGWGHTKDVVEGDTCTLQQAEDWLCEDLHEAESCIARSVTVPLNQCQFDALASFTFNLGSGNLRSSTLLKLLNSGDYLGASRQFLVWYRAGGKILEGLTKRRMDEMKLFMKECE